MSIAEAFAETFHKFPEKMAIEFNGKNVTFGELDAVTNRISII